MKVILLMARLSIHIRILPSFLGTKRAGTAQGLETLEQALLRLVSQPIFEFLLYPLGSFDRLVYLEVWL